MLGRCLVYRVTQNIRLISLGHLGILLYVVCSYEDIASDLNITSRKPSLRKTRLQWY